jgi:cob(I)alamin adenosyltransferase
MAETSEHRFGGEEFGEEGLGEKGFDQPRVAINRVYTRRGDAGETGLVGGQRVAKDDLRIECYGTVDELNAFIGLARHTAESQQCEFPWLGFLAAILKRVQHELFNLGSILATRPEDMHPRQPRVTARETAQLEREMDQALGGLAPLRSFVLPGGSRLNAELHICRTVCRRAERIAVSLARDQQVDGDTLKYLNRLSDALFVWSRWASKETQSPETLWQPNEATSGLEEESKHD